MTSQLMGSLPTVRTTPAKPFTNTGNDYAGPLLIKHKARSPGEKCYVALFICFTVKAIHLELVSSASTEAFLAALRRFMARRGKPRNMFSDNGSNFLGAQKELKRLLKSKDHNARVANSLSSDNIEWHFSPAGAPHFGGLWEAGVKSVKQHLKRTIGGMSLTFEELNTVLVQIEACLNSRPLCPLSTDPSDFQALTPGHFLVGTELNALPEIDLTDVKVNRLNRWQHVQSLYQLFWKRWSLEYIARLQNRPKWTKVQRNLEIDDLVIIREDNLPPLKWLMARVVELHPGEDGLVRVATLKMVNGVVKRPIRKLAMLLSSQADTC
ncbi:uncharacterized protein LOC135484767 [Lineus longissimus]|uniref:uncharacterized protein LOC135484767 n=1 Tax=Lineus longissimus TaxID=88925 RepID=UPI00315CCE3F